MYANLFRKWVGALYIRDEAQALRDSVAAFKKDHVHHAQRRGSCE